MSNKLVIFVLLVILLTADGITAMVSSVAQTPIDQLQTTFGYAWVVIARGGISSSLTVINFSPKFPAIGPAGCTQQNPGTCNLPLFAAGAVSWNASTPSNVVSSGPVGFAEEVTVFQQNQTLWASMPNATTEVFGTTNDRIAMNATYTTFVSIAVNILQSSTSKVPADLKLQLSTNGGVTWRNSCQGLGANCPLIFLNQTGLIISKWKQAGAIAGASPNNIQYRIVGDNGNNTSVKILSMQLRLLTPIGSPQVGIASANPVDTDLDVNHAEVQVILPATFTNALNVTFWWQASMFVPTGGVTSPCMNPTVSGPPTIPMFTCNGR